MKRLILIAALLLPVTSQAADYCVEVASAAKTVMINRLNGISQARHEKLARELLDGAELGVVLELIDDAYQQPDSRDKEKAANSFALTWLIKCSRAGNEGI